MENWTPEQIQIITTAVKAARLSCAGTQPTALDFFESFQASGGVQIPGPTQPAQPDICRLVNTIRTCLANKTGARVNQSEPKWFFTSLVREINRTLSEINWLSAASHSSVHGFMLTIRNVADKNLCESWLQLHSKNSIFTKHSVVVLPPCCDYGSFRVVFEDEVN